MNKLMIDEIHSERREVEAWCMSHGVEPDARDELMKILYGTKHLIKGAIHDRQ